MNLFDDTQLFNSGKLTVTKFAIPDAELTLYEHFFDRATSDIYYKTLLEQTKWEQHPITIHGNTYLTPRLTCWYCTKRESRKGNPAPASLQAMQEKIEICSGLKFNSVLLNLYRSGQDSVAWHRDNEKEFGTNPVIGSVSFGETRPFEIRHKFRKDLKKITIPLNHGSFLLMAGSMQHYWEHQVPKTAKLIQPRINCTFRITH